MVFHYFEETLPDSDHLLLQHLSSLDDKIATWDSERNEHSITFKRTWGGVCEKWTLEESLRTTPEAHALLTLSQALKDVLGKNLTLHITSRGEDKQEDFACFAPLASLLAEIGSKGVSIRRNKGLGEMDDEELWQTTMDPEARTLLQIKMQHVEEAEEIFSTLMGDVVEPRRDFITSNALKVVNLDV